LRKAGGVLPDAPLQYRLTQAGSERLDSLAGRAKAQHALLQYLATGSKSVEDLKSLGERWRTTLNRVIEQEWVLSEPLQLTPTIADSGPELTDEQQQAITAIQKSGKGYSTHLLDGVTGSGKTEVYLQLLQPV